MLLALFPSRNFVSIIKQDAQISTFCNCRKPKLDSLGRSRRSPECISYFFNVSSESIMANVVSVITMMLLQLMWQKENEHGIK